MILCVFAPLRELFHCCGEKPKNQKLILFQLPQFAILLFHH
jgi:hypothetical protein